MNKADDDLKERFKNELEELESIPSLPAVIPRLISILDKPDTTADEVSNVLQLDPALTAKVFRLINSSYYGLRREINSIREAVSYIGFNTIRNLAITAGVIDRFSEDLSSQEGRIRFNWYKLWKYSIATGIAAETVGRHIRFRNHENAMVSGILHRLGLIVLETHFGEYMDAVVRCQRENPRPLRQVEREVLGFDEQEIGLWLAKSWDFPPSIVGGIGYHERPLELSEDEDNDHVGTIALLVNVGKNMAHKAGYSLSIEQKEPVLSRDVLQALELDQQTMTILMDQFRKDLEDAHVFMDMIDKLEDE
jgi:HD-like signal output (HDOD) protein